MGAQGQALIKKEVQTNSCGNGGGESTECKVERQHGEESKRMQEEESKRINQMIHCNGKS